MESFGRFVMLFGGILLILGFLLTFARNLPYIGRLPGDIHFERGSYSFYYPVTTCVLLSVIITVILKIVARRW